MSVSGRPIQVESEAGEQRPVVRRKGMDQKRLAALTLGVLLAAGSGWARAHHNTSARYDAANPITLTGTVVRFRMVNPHSQVEFEVKDEQSNVVTWTAEAGPPSNMYRRGWRTEDLQPGDPVVVTGQPAFDGSAAMRLVKLEGPNGKVLE